MASETLVAISKQAGEKKRCRTWNVKALMKKEIGKCTSKTCG
jgi:hypothetical protein